METRRIVKLSVNDVKNLPSNFDNSEDTMATHYALNIYCFGSGRIICILNMCYRTIYHFTPSRHLQLVFFTSENFGTA
jgi:hypothetical protein